MLKGVYHLSGRKKTSSVWNFFDIDESNDSCVCVVVKSNKRLHDGTDKVEICGVKLSGKNATNLKTHLRTNHNAEFQIFLDLEKRRKEAIEGNVFSHQSTFLEYQRKISEEDAHAMYSIGSGEDSGIFDNCVASSSSLGLGEINITTIKLENEEKAVTPSNYFKHIMSPTVSQTTQEDDDNLFWKMLTAEIKKISHPGMKRKLKRQLLETVHLIQDEQEACDQHHKQLQVLRELSDNFNSQNLVPENKFQGFR